MKQNLSPEALRSVSVGKSKEPEGSKLSTRYKIVFIAFISAAVLAVALLGILLYRVSVSADIPQVPSLPTAGLEVSASSTQVSSGDIVQLNITVANNSGRAMENLTVLSHGYGINFQTGSDRALRKEELQKFSSGSDDQGVYWTAGTLQIGESKKHQFTAQAAQIDSPNFEIKADFKLWQVETTGQRCGFLWLRRCNVTTLGSQLAETSQAFELKTTESAAENIKLSPGFNFITLPYTISPQDISAFLARLQTKWAWYYDPSSAQWVDLIQSENQSKIAPGVGFWVYDSGGTSYPLPENRIALDPNSSFTVNLKKGYNQLGNPYPKRIKWRADKILVRKGSSATDQTGELKSFTDAVSYGWLSYPYVYQTVSSSTAGSIVSSTISLSDYKQITSGSYIDSYIGFYIEAMEDVSIVFPGKSIFAPGELLSAEEKKKILSWLDKNNLNACGNAKSPSDYETSSLYDEITGEILDQFDCILLQHPEREWLSP